MKKIEEYYQRLIYADIKQPRYLWLRKFFPLFTLGFFALMAVYYKLYFYNRIWRRISTLMFFHQNPIYDIRPKTVMYLYDYMLSFFFYLFCIFVFSILAFIAFDSFQRNEIIRKLAKNQKDPFEEEKENP